MSISTESDVRALIAKIGSEGYRDGSSTVAGRPYQPIPFPEFADIPVQKDVVVVAEDQLIADHVNSVDVNPIESFLDVGANIGYHSFRWAQRGVRRVVAVEKDPLNGRVLAALSEWSGLKVELTDDVAKVIYAGEHFGLCTMLNVHHWMHKQLGAGRTVEVMRSLSGLVKHFYFQTAHFGSPSLYTVPELTGARDIEAYLAEVGFSGVTLVATSQGGRFLFYARGNG